MITQVFVNSIPRTCTFPTNLATKFCFSKPSSLYSAERKNVSRSLNVVPAIARNVHLRARYFYANAILEEATTKINKASSIAQEIPHVSRNGEPNSLSLLPHRQRRYARDHAIAREDFLPSNSATSLSIKASVLPSNSLRRVFSVLLALSKPRLTILVVLTACASYALYPVPELLLPSSTSTPSLSPLTLFFLTSGTALCAASANTFNMLYEPQWDALMLRTRNRPLVRGLISTRWATVFAILTGATGVTSLYFGVNPTVSFLGLFNIALYAGIYTPLKRVSVLNTWVGALVGALPPLMGWAAAAGQRATVGNDWSELLLGECNIGGWLLACLLFAWQFPHFMSLSWSVREEYKNAGYRMLCWVNPALNARVALRYSILFFPICISLSYFDVTEWSFTFVSTPINVWLLLQAVKFWRFEGARGSARGLFWASVWHLPVVMILAMTQKKGMWQKISGAMGNNESEEYPQDEIIL
ncbi:Protoheme IX farnesyltransferase, mitochondrial [Golovinomyces cichoracearum]|uniref:Protoheme IX farnesyltransferase, mitochondrial n=1 Tax=Golovinomyces cichoracearum TaxID=62708 RepID=A0A420IGI7_9PEZI|nr:Protoheme IX farnesyltransferase, mitochondrial [Golovinomyces cichoracearum]